MLYIIKTNDHPGQQKVIYAWYDQRKPRLAQAFRNLTELTHEVHTRLGYSFMLPTAITAITVGLVISQEWPVVSVLLCLLGGLLASAPWLEYHWRLRTYRAAANERIARIKRGDYGHAVLWSDDVLWGILAKALEAQGVKKLEDVLNNATPAAQLAAVLAPLLKQTRIIRGQLLTRADEDATAHLLALAVPAAGVIANLYQTASLTGASQPLVSWED